MRRSLGKFTNPNAIGSRSFILSPYSAAFSSSAGGRGRGRGASDFSNSQFAPGVTQPDDFKDESESPLNPFPVGNGQGRGRILPPFSSFVNNTADTLTSATPPPPPPPPTTTGPGHGSAAGATMGRSSQPQRPPSQLHQDQSSHQRKPIFFLREEVKDVQDNTTTPRPATKPLEDTDLPASILSVLSPGMGRGKPIKPPSVDKPQEVNRHIRPRKPKVNFVSEEAQAENEEVLPSAPPSRRMSREEAVKNAVGILSRGSDREERVGGVGRRGRGSFGARGRGRARGRSRGDAFTRGRREEYSEDDYVSDLDSGDPADEEKFAEKVGPEIMNQLVEGFEEMSSTVLPTEEDDAYLDALHTNLMIECEPEYLMEEFGTNPDIDEKPPIPLRDALEKMKPFLMAYEGIQSQEEWEEVIRETMEKVPLLKEIVDYYSGPDRVTAKQQQEELERVASTLPKSAPASVKHFTERAVLSLQSNPGWGFDKKCQFMDKLVWEVSQHYK